MRQAKVRSVVFADPLYSSGSKLLLVILALAVMGHYFYQEGMDIWANWDNQVFWSEA